jgi:hypothetical protein
MSLRAEGEAISFSSFAEIATSPWRAPRNDKYGKESFCQERDSSLPAVAQNDITQEPVISSEARNPWDDSHTSTSMDLGPLTSRHSFELFSVSLQGFLTPSGGSK